jgi:O-antigen/teichoic acid export membrane protein
MKIPKKLRNLLVPGQRLSQRVVFAGAWMLAMRVARQGFSIVRLIILARLLSPEAFGLVSVALVVLALLTTITEFGFGEALIQHKGDIQHYLDTFWIMSAIRGLVLAGVIFGIAPFAASYFNAPDAKPIIQAMAATLVINGFVSSGMVYFYKELEVQKRFVWEISGLFSDIVISISTAFILRSAWALVYGSIASSIVMMVVSFIMHPYRPKLRFDILKAKELFKFGWWVLLYGVMNYIFTSADTIIIGRLLGVVSLGLYTMAHKIGDLIGREMGLASSGIIFPTYSKLQDIQDQLRRAFLTCTEAVAFVTFPAAVGIYVLAPDFTDVLLGKQWTQAVPAMQILGIAAAIYSLIITGGSLFYAVGKPRTRFLIMAVASFIMVGLLFPLSKEFGLVGAAMAVLAGNVGGLLCLTLASAGILKSSVKELMRPLVFPIIVSIIMGVLLMLAKHAFNQVGLGEFIILLCIAAAVYAACSLMLWRLFKSGPVQILNIFRGRK